MIRNIAILIFILMATGLLVYEVAKYSWERNMRELAINNGCAAYNSTTGVFEWNLDRKMQKVDTDQIGIYLGNLPVPASALAKKHGK